ncbi:MAG: hypothetical protein ACRBF0_22560 [Calditrichia bacterium]
MKPILLTALLMIGMALNILQAETLADKVRFASTEQAKKLLTQEDEFTKSWSPFDIDSRMQKKNSTRQELFDFIAEQARNWTNDETEKLQSIFQSIDEQIAEQGFAIPFPNEIFFVKTTTKEEGGAGGYTRANYVVLKEDILSRPTEDLTRTVIHELFHVLSRNNPEFRKALYEIIGFKLMNSVDYPDSLSTFRITNPDAPQTDSYITLTVNEKPVDCMMILYSNREYNGGAFFEYLNIGFLQLTGDRNKTALMVGEKPVIYTLKQVANFFEQIGGNTKYIIHPEEIMADNFTLAILNRMELPDQHIVEQIKMQLKK